MLPHSCTQERSTLQKMRFRGIDPRCAAPNNFFRRLRRYVIVVNPERRRNLRVAEDAAIVYSFFNQSKQYDAVARNFSRFGMYFESYSALSPGTIILVKATGCAAPGADGAGKSDRGGAQENCKHSRLSSGALRVLKAVVTAQVKRCDPSPGAEGERYGIAVHYVSPAV